MKTKRSHEGYFLLDNSNSPGVPDAIVVPQGLNPGAGRGKFESATYTCSHCETVVVLNPNRTRPKWYCKACDHYACDRCEAEFIRTGVCYPWKARIADALELVDKGMDPTAAYEKIFVRGERPLAIVVPESVIVPA